MEEIQKHRDCKVGDTFKDGCVEGSRQWEGKAGKDRA